VSTTTRLLQSPLVSTALVWMQDGRRHDHPGTDYSTPLGEGQSLTLREAILLMSKESSGIPAQKLTDCRSA